MNPFSQIYKHLAISIIFSLIGLIVGNIFIPESMIYIANSIVVVLMILLLILALCSRQGIIPKRFSMNYVYLFTFIQGIIIYPMINYYLYDLGIGMVISIFIATIFIFSSLAIYAKNSNSSSILNYGKVLIISLIGIIISSLINIFLGSSTLSIIISALGILIFSIYVIYDINLIKRTIQCSTINDKNDLSIHVLNLYIDFLNLLLDLLNLVSKSKK